jgi:hypothetical protein
MKRSEIAMPQVYARPMTHLTPVPPRLPEFLATAYPVGKPKR